MKILIIARTCPYPANDGEKIRVYNMIRHLSHHDIVLVCRVMSEEEQKGLHEMEKYCSEVHGEFIPSPRSFIEKVSWVAPFLFSRYPISLSTIYFKSIAAHIRTLCDQHTFDVVQVEHSSLTIYLDGMAFKNRPRRVLVMHNIDYIRYQRVLENLPFGVKKLFYRLNQAKFKQWELSTLARYDNIVAMSDEDRSSLLQDQSGLHVTVIPNGVDTGEFSLSPETGQKQEPHIVFVASMDSDANHDGALFFLDHVFDRIKKEVPGIRVSFVGRSPRNELLQRHNGSDVTVTGMVDHVMPYYRKASVAVVPLRSGGGTRLKILEAMAAGVPVVSTTIGAEGLNVKHDEHLLVDDSPGGFARCVISLLESAELRDRLIKAARQKVETEYDWVIVAARFDGLVNHPCSRNRLPGTLDKS